MNKLWFWFLNLFAGVILSSTIFTIECNVQSEYPFEITEDFVTFTVANIETREHSEKIAKVVRDIIEQNPNVFINIQNEDFLTTWRYDGRIVNEAFYLAERWDGEYTVAFLGENEMSELCEVFTDNEIFSYTVHKKSGKIKRCITQLLNNMNFLMMVFGTFITYHAYKSCIRIALVNRLKSIYIFYLLGANNRQLILCTLKRSILNVVICAIVATVISEWLFSYIEINKRFFAMLFGIFFIMILHETILIIEVLRDFRMCRDR